MEFIMVLVGIGLFGLASQFWGEDTRYGLTDPEWDRRRIWRGFRRG
jgi:hypothetical protein